VFPPGPTTTIPSCLRASNFSNLKLFTSLKVCGILTCVHLIRRSRITSGIYPKCMYLCHVSRNMMTMNYFGTLLRVHRFTPCPFWIWRSKFTLGLQDSTVSILSVSPRVPSYIDGSWPFGYLGFRCFKYQWETLEWISRSF
jgi:hypothetical protein